MTFVSYAQNFEDVMLWRALKHVEGGFYVDVGAQHPVIDSVSKAFYEHGWRGMHIEPVPEFAELLRKDRPDETVLQVALSDVEGTLEINVLPGTGLSTFIDAYAGRHRKQHGVEPVRVMVPMLTLAQVLRDNTGRQTHWLKIDVEGFEERVLKGWDSKAFRPWIIVIEATVPGLPELDHRKWDCILVAADYKFVYFDGLNRFYVAREHSELESAFSSPPNVFDGVQLSGQATSPFCQGLIATHLESTQERDARAVKLTEDLDAAHQRTELLGVELQTSLESEARQQDNTQRLKEGLATADVKINALESRTLGLQDGWDASRRDVGALEHQVGALEAKVRVREQQAGALEQQVGVRERQAGALEQQVGVLEQQVGMRERQVGALEQQVAALERQGGAINVEITGLQGELSAATAKAEEHRASTNHWWTVADGLNQELRSVYSSRSWRITAPLRHAVRAAGGCWRVAARTARRVVGLPRRAAGVMLRWARRGRPERQAMTESARPEADASGTTSALVAESSLLIKHAAEAELRTRMSPRAYRILAQLRRSIGARAR